MAAPVLSDYHYQFKDTGIVLNGDWDAAYPGFVDVETIQGLDLPPFSVASYDNDAQHGGNTFVKFADQRTIIINGVVYTSAASADVFLDKLFSNFLPDNNIWPFYYKPAGLTQRYISVKSIGAKSDLTTARRIGSAPIQIQLIAEDPTKKIDNALLTMISATSYTVANNGTVDTYPIFTITGAFSTMTLRNSTTNQNLVITTTALVGDVTVVDFRKRSVTINGVQNSATASGPWWAIAPGGNSTIRATATGATPTSIQAATYSGWL